MTERADFEACQRVCTCAECNPELSDGERKRLRVIEALRCRCLVCRDRFRPAR